MKKPLLQRWLSPLNLLRELSIRKPADLLKIPAMAVLIALFAFSPILVAMLAGALGRFLGCTINEGGTDHCIRWGIPVGTILSAVSVCGWFALITLPVGLVLLIMWLVKSAKGVRLYRCKGNCSGTTNKEVIPVVVIALKGRDRQLAYSIYSPFDRSNTVFFVVTTVVCRPEDFYFSPT